MALFGLGSAASSMHYQLLANESQRLASVRQGSIRMKNAAGRAVAATLRCPALMLARRVGWFSLRLLQMLALRVGGPYVLLERGSPLLGARRRRNSVTGRIVRTSFCGPRDSFLHLARDSDAYLCVAICQVFPHSSRTIARLSPYGVLVGSSIEAALAAIARL